ncbi:MAG: DUF6090 family protein [Ignavibacteriaceae bacterium]
MEKINWKNYFIELIVVFIGITAAFLLNNWREDYESDELESKYINSIKNDVIQDSISVHEILKFNEEKEVKFKKYIESTIKGISSIDSAVILFQDILTIPKFYSQSNTYESIKYSGNLNIISDYNLREETTNYYESFTTIQSQQEMTVEFINDYATKFVFNNINILNWQIINKKNIDFTEVNNIIVGYYALLEQNIKLEKEIVIRNKELLKKLNI